MARYREYEIKVFLSKEEYKHLQEKMALVGMTNRSQYVRKMILDGYIINVDIKPIKQLIYEINKIGVNVNQFLHVVNLNNLKGEPIIKEDIDKIEHYLNQIYAKVSSVLNLIIK